MANPVETTLTAVNTWVEVVAPVGAESDVMIQAKRGGKYEWRIDTSSPETTENGYVGATGEPIFSVRLATSDGLYARLTRGDVKLMTQVRTV